MLGLRQRAASHAHQCKRCSVAVAVGAAAELQLVERSPDALSSPTESDSMASAIPRRSELQADELQVDAALCSSSVDEFKDEFEFSEITDDDGAADSARETTGVDGARARADSCLSTAAAGDVPVRG